MPVDGDVFSIDDGRPGPCALVERPQIWDAAFAKALARIDIDGDLSLVKPTAVLGSIMDFKSIPEFFGFLLAEVSDQRLQPVGVEIVHDQDDPLTGSVSFGQRGKESSKVFCRAFGGYCGEVFSTLRLHCAEDIAGSIALVFIVHALALAGKNSRRWSDILQQLNRLLIQAKEGNSRVSGALIERKNVFHSLNELLIECGHTPTLLSPRF